MCVSVCVYKLAVETIELRVGGPPTYNMYYMYIECVCVCVSIASCIFLSVYNKLDMNIENSKLIETKHE